MFLMCRIALVHSSVATISASADEQAVRDWRLETQYMGPQSQTKKPEMDSGF